MIAVNFDSAAQNFTPQAATVWTRTKWSNDWTERTDLIPLAAEWNLAPEASTATLHKRYGRVLLPGQSAFATITKETTRGYWVLIEYPDDAASGANWYWLGYAESAIDSNHHPSRNGLPEAGEQIIPCFGFLQVLEQAVITSAVHVDPADDAELLRAMGGMVFNANEAGNRHTAKATITEGSNESDEAYGFALPDKTDADYWSTRDIVEHLFAFHLPTATGLKGSIPFSITGLDLLPSWDRPVVDTESRSVASILVELISPDKLLSFGMGAIATAGSPPSITSVNVTIQTTVANSLTLPAFGTVPANTNQFSIVNTIDPHTFMNVTADDSDVVDQVIVRGPREIGIGTFTYTDELDKDWSTADQSAYEDGAKLSTGWSGLDQYAKRERNEIVRAAANLQKVYRRLKLKKTWDGMIGGSDHVFVQTGSPPTTYVPFLANCRFLETLPLYAGVDYSGDPTAVDETSGQDPIPPLVGLENPTSTLIEVTTRSGQFTSGFNATDPDTIPFAVSVAPNNDAGPKIDLLVSGAPNHAIAGTGYVGNTADADHALVYGGWDYDTVEATLAIEGDRRPHWKIPDDTAVSVLDVVRKKIVTIEHPDLQLVHIANGTTVGFDDVGAKETSTGGVLRDPTNIIKSLATIYAQFHLNSRKRLELRTLRRPTQLSVGGIITTVSEFGTVDAVIRSISLSTPLAGDGAASVSVIAASERFDPMQLVTQRNRFGQDQAPETTGPNKRDKIIAKRAERKLDRLAELVGFDRKRGVMIPKAGINFPA